MSAHVGGLGLESLPGYLSFCSFGHSRVQSFAAMALVVDAVEVVVCQ